MNSRIEQLLIWCQMMEMEQGNRSLRRTAFRRTEILKAASSLFALKGYRAATIRDIAVRADISEGSIYNYFENKEKLFAALIDKLIELQSIEGMYTKSLPIDIRAFLDAVFQIQHDFLNSNRELVKAVLPEIIINEHYREKFFRDFLTPAISYFTLQFQARDVLGQIKPSNHQMVSHSLVGLLYGYYLMELLDDPIFVERWESLLEYTVSLIYEGLSPEQVSLK